MGSVALWGIIRFVANYGVCRIMGFVVVSNQGTVVRIFQFIYSHESKNQLGPDNQAKRYTHFSFIMAAGGGCFIMVGRMFYNGGEGRMFF